jgi:hypothetical protein
MKIKIYTGVTVEPEKCVLDNLHPKHQIEHIKLWVNLKAEFKLTTNSDFIIRELNYFITEGLLKKEDIEFFEDGVQLEGDDGGYECVSIDEVIEEQNKRCEESYYKMKYGDM